MGLLLTTTLNIIPLFAAAQNDEKVNEELTAKWRQTFHKILPAGWSIQVTGQAYPTRHVPGIAEGIEIDFRGTQNAKFTGRPESNKNKEEFKLWLMPLNYTPKIVPIDPANVGAFSRLPEHLGSNDTYQVYCFTTLSSLQSWSTWKEDIKKLFKLELDKTSDVLIKPRHVPCQDITKCTFLGTIETSSGSTYKLQIDPKDPRVYFLRTGDCVGEYIVSKNNFSDGKEKLILKKDGNEFPIERTDSRAISQQSTNELSGLRAGQGTNGIFFPPSTNAFMK